MEQDKSLIEYEKHLQELECQREKLEIALQMMGQEWEESGAGIAWMGSLDLPLIQHETTSNTTPGSETSTATATTDVLLQSPIATTETSFLSIATTDDSSSSSIPTSTTATTATTTLEPLLFKNILSVNTGPSPEYLQSLLHVNETLLAQSLANATAVSNSTPLLTPTENEPMVLIESGNNNDTQNEYNTIHPESESIISPLLSIMDNKLTLSSSSTHSNHHHIQS